MNFFLRMAFWGIALCVPTGLVFSAELPKTITIYFTESKQPIFNPGMGFYVAGWNHHRKGDLPAYTDLVYNRFMWRDLEPIEGVYRFDKLKKFIAYWKQQDCRVAFRIITSNLSGTQTPEYVFDAGVPGVIHKPENGVQTDPVYWNGLYIDLLSRFINSLAMELNGGDGIEFIDVGGIGVFGEMNLGLHIPGMWTQDELRRHQFTSHKYFEAYKKLIAAYQFAFHNTTLFLNISRYDNITEYAAKQHVGLRYDGLSLKYNPTHMKVSSAFKQFGRNIAPIKTGVPCMYEFAFKETEKSVIQKCLEKAFKDPISYLHINLGKTSSLSRDVYALLKKYANSVGYRFLLESMTIPKTMDSGMNYQLILSFINIGVANIYEDLDIKIVFYKRTERVFTRNIVPEILTSKWYPGRTITLSCSLEIPEELSDGEYELYLALVNEDSGEIIKIASETNYRDRYARLGIISFDGGKGFFIPSAF